MTRRRVKNVSSHNGRIVGSFELEYRGRIIPIRLRTGREVDPDEQFVVAVDEPFKIRVTGNTAFEVECKTKEIVRCNGEVKWQKYALVTTEIDDGFHRGDGATRRIEFSWTTVWAGKVGQKWFHKMGESDYIEHGRPDEGGKRGRTLDKSKSAAMILFTPEAETKLNAIAGQFDLLHKMLYDAMNGAALARTLEQLGVPGLPAPMGGGV